MGDLWVWADRRMADALAWCRDVTCDPCGHIYNSRFEELARRPTSDELLSAYRYARRRGLDFESVSFEKSAAIVRT